MQRDLVQRAMAHDHEAFTNLARLSIDRLYVVARLILHDEERANDAVQESAPDDIGAVADRDQLDRAFLHLPPDQRALIVPHYYVGLPLMDTADALGLPVGTVKSRLHRATRSMRATLDADARRTGLVGDRLA